jgi:hypothetical protein
VDPIPAHQRQHLEKTRTDRFSRHRYTDGVDERRGFHTARFSRRAQHGLN